jgi:Gpi18-like mannosyltransferase
LAGFASSLAFKLQATFLGPAVVLELVLARRRVAALLAGVVTYVIWLLPAALAGRPIQDLLTVYVRQMAEQPYLARNAANPWALWEIADPRYSRRTYAIATLVGVAVSAVVALMLVRILTRSIAQGRSRRLESYCAIALIVPFLLPKMHERYFFVADVLALTLACCDRRWIALAALVQLGSLGGYITYFFAFERWVPGVYPTVLAIGVVANIFALRLLGHWLRDQSRGRSPEIA